MKPAANAMMLSLVVTLATGRVISAHDQSPLPTGLDTRQSRPADTLKTSAIVNHRITSADANPM